MTRAWVARARGGRPAYGGPASVFRTDLLEQGTARQTACIIMQPHPNPSESRSVLSFAIGQVVEPAPEHADPKLVHALRQLRLPLIRIPNGTPSIWNAWHLDARHILKQNVTDAHYKDCNDCNTATGLQLNLNRPG